MNTKNQKFGTDDKNEQSSTRVEGQRMQKHQAGQEGGQGQHKEMREGGKVSFSLFLICLTVKTMDSNLKSGILLTPKLEPRNRCQLGKFP